MANLNIVIPKPNIQELGIKIVGTSPLVEHRWSEKAKREMLEKHLKKAKKARPKRNPQKEFEQSLHIMKKGKFKYLSGHEIGVGEIQFSGKIGIPATAIKSAIVSAARNIEGLAMTLLRGAIFVEGDESGLVEAKYNKLLMREDVCRTSGIGRTPDLRYRGELQGWSAKFTIRFNGDVLSAEQVVNLLSTAGFACGLLEMRPEKTGMGFGCFKVV